MRAVTVRATTMTAALAVVLGACTSGRHSGMVTSLAPAMTVGGSRVASTASTVPAGLSAMLPDQVAITVASLTAGGDDLGAWLTIDVRVDNHSAHSQRLPSIGIVCAGGSTVGLHRAVSTLSLSGELPAGASRVGTLMLLLPGDRRLGGGGGVAACPAPAVVQVFERPHTGSAAPLLRVPIPDQVLARLNATRNK